MLRDLPLPLVIVAILGCHMTAAAAPVKLPVTEVRLIQRGETWSQRIVHQTTDDGGQPPANGETQYYVELPKGSTSLPARLLVEPAGRWSYRLAVSLPSPVAAGGDAAALAGYENFPVIVYPDKRTPVSGILVDVAGDRLAISETLGDRQRIHFIDGRTVLAIDNLRAVSKEHSSFLILTSHEPASGRPIHVEYELPMAAPTITYHAQLQHDRPLTRLTAALQLTNQSAHDWQSVDIKLDLQQQPKPFPITTSDLPAGSTASAAIMNYVQDATVRWQWRLTASGLAAAPDLIIQQLIVPGLDGKLLLSEQDGPFRMERSVSPGDAIVLQDVSGLGWHRITSTAPAVEEIATGLNGIWLTLQQSRTNAQRISLTTAGAVPLEIILDKNNEKSITSCGDYTVTTATQNHRLLDMRSTSHRKLGEVALALDDEDTVQFQQRRAEIGEIEELYRQRQVIDRQHLTSEINQQILGQTVASRNELALHAAAESANTEQLAELHRWHQALATQLPAPLPSALVAFTVQPAKPSPAAESGCTPQPETALRAGVIDEPGVSLSPARPSDDDVPPLPAQPTQEMLPEPIEAVQESAN